ncbi:alkylmercury lyase [Streptomyces sp. NPDC001530]|uniref:alkylmercury lyase n=1 Tax=Streptomyces sp. NPDC001530 TaxID=3364582 RepID=UPI0036A31B90
MELVVLTVPDCPNAPAMLQHLKQVLPRDAAPVDVRVITSEEEATQMGMHGSPTLLINGSDPFAPPDAAVSFSCRIYRNADGRTSGAPSIEQPADVLKRAGRGE